MKNKSGQITIFIILALIIVVSIALVTVIFRKPSSVQAVNEENPQAYIESCINDYVDEAVNLLSEQGGDINPQGSVMFKGRNITYLCYTSGFYFPCVNQRPMLAEHIEKEITNYIKPKAENCFNALKAQLEQKNYNVAMGSMKLTTKLQPKQIVVNIDRNFKMSKNEKIKEYKTFKSIINNPIYDLTEIAMEIVNQEARYCNFDILGFMVIYPEYDIQKFRTGDSDIIYTLREIASNQRFIFSIRSCALPAGF
jgi:hypothetical protein